MQMPKFYYRNRFRPRRGREGIWNLRCAILVNVCLEAVEDSKVYALDMYLGTVGAIHKSLRPPVECTPQVYMYILAIQGSNVVPTNVNSNPYKEI